MNLTDFFKKSNFSFCIKDKNWKVLYQNTKCVSLCGDRLNFECQDRCRQYAVNQDGLQFSPQKKIEDSIFDIFFYFDESGIITLLNDPTDRNFYLYKEITKYNLTNRELQILKLRIQGFKNKEIEKNLCISHPTLKTHINNIRKKIPSGLIVKIIKNSLIH